MASSSIVMMPQSASGRSQGTSVAAGFMGVMQTRSLTQDSSLTAGSKLSSMDDTASDAGSVASSISLISMPSSEDEDWQDSRTHLTTPPQVSRDAAEYIVLYDDSSSGED